MTTCSAAHTGPFVTPYGKFIRRSEIYRMVITRKVEAVFRRITLCSRSDSSVAVKESTVNNIPFHNRGVNARDVRIDFFRGLALYMILVDHVIGDPISKFTYQRFGFSDAAEICPASRVALYIPVS